MPSEQQLSAAVERLRRVNAGDDERDVYETLNDDFALVLLRNDEKTLADAYLALGTRQPGYLQRDVSGNRTALIDKNGNRVFKRKGE